MTIKYTPIMGRMKGFVKMKVFRSPLRDKQLDPPLRYCTRCGSEIYYGRDTLCDACLEVTSGRETMVEYMFAYPKQFRAFLDENRDEPWMDKFFEEYYSHAIGDGPDGPDYERWRRS